MALHADEIADKEFVPSLRGYNRNEVRAFLRAVGAEHERLAEGGERDVVESLRQVLSAQKRLLEEQSDPVPADDLLRTVRDMLALQEEMVASQRMAAKRLEEAGTRLDEALTELRWASGHVRHAGRVTEGPPREPDRVVEAMEPLRVAAVSRRAARSGR